MAWGGACAGRSRVTGTTYQNPPIICFRNTIGSVPDL